MIYIFKIGEFSRLTQVSIRMLRYYDETGLLKPAQIDKFTGYRLYSIEQIPTLNKIIFLRDTGFNVSEIAVALNCWENDFIAKLLEKRQQEIKDTIKLEQEKSDKISHAIKDISKEKISLNYNVVIKSIPSYQVISLRKVIPNYFSEIILWEELGSFIETNKIKISKNDLNFAIYHDKEYKELDVDVEVCMAVDKIVKCKDGFVYRKTEAIETMACTMVYGAYKNLSDAYLSFADWLSHHNQYSMTTQPNRQICHRGPWNEENSDKYLTEIQFVVKNINTY